LLPFSLFASGNTSFEQFNGEIVYEMTPPSGCFVSSRRELMITGLSVVDDPVLGLFQSYLGAESTKRVGAQHTLNAEYFKRIDALNYTMLHDDGQHTDDLEHADVVLTGVSRTSKTPTSMHLGYMGYMSANIPIVRGVDPPPSLFQIDGWKLVGLTIDAERLSEIRRRRVRALAAGAGARYADLEEIYEELELTAALHKRLGCPVIDVTGLAIEETAARAAELVEARRRAALEGVRA